MKPILPALSIFLDRLSGLARLALAELVAWFSPRGNPFVVWSRATALRGGPLTGTVIALGVLWALAFALDWAAVGADPDNDAARDGALLWIGLVLVATFLARVARCTALLRIEVMKNRFETLQLLPLDSARRAWLLCAPVTQFAGLVGALAWPALAWGAGSKLLALHDVFGLLFLFLVASQGTPLWRPHQWRAQLDKKGAGSASDGFVAPVDAPLEAFWSSGAFLVLAALVAAGVGGEAPFAYWDGLPAHLRASAERLWLNWPLFAARWLFEAQPFFGFALAPILVLGPVWAAGVHNAVLRLGAVTALEPYWTPQRRRNWRRAAWLQWAGAAALFVGLLWPGAIGGGWLGDWFLGVPRSSGWALAFWWLAALFGAVFGAAARWKNALAPGKPATLQLQTRRALRSLLRPWALALGVFFGCCVLGGVWPLGAAWRQIAPATLAVAATWLGAALVTSAGQRVPHLTTFFGRLNWLWFYGGPSLILALSWANVDLRPLTPQLYFLSPWTLWWSLRQPAIAGDALFRLAIGVHALLIAALAAWLWRARATVIGPQTAEKTAISLRDAWSVAPPDAQPMARPARDETDDAATSPGNEDDDEDDESDEDDSGVQTGRAVLQRQNLPAPDATLSRVLERLQRFENPVLCLETRRVIGNGLRGTGEMALFINGAFALFLLVALPAWGLYTGAFPFEFAAMALAIALLVWCAIPLNGIEGTSRCYDHDRVDGSLQMLFLTPLTQRQIAGGKIGPFLLRALFLLALYSPLWILGVVAALIGRDAMVIVVYLLAPLFALSFALRVATISHWTALRKRKVGVVSVPWFISVGAFIVLPGELMVLFSSTEAGALGLAGAIVALSLVFWAESALFWWLGLSHLRHRRTLNRTDAS